MKIRLTLLTAACATALIALAVSLAALAFHPANGEVGYTDHPGHAAKSSLSREQVRAEIKGGAQGRLALP